jgi:amino acid adenylation domain-containing protein
MIPSRIITVEALPLTSNGKIDREALLACDISTTVQETYIAPANETEIAIAAIWKNILGVEKPGVYDDFFELGGHSLLAIRVISAIRNELGIEISIQDLFSHPTISGLVSIAAINKRSTLPTLVLQERPAYIPLSFSQERLWFIDKLQGSINYHIPSVIRIEGLLNIPALEGAIEMVIARHEILRTVIRERDGIPYQEVLSGQAWDLPYTTSEQDAASIKAIVEATIYAPFDMSAGFMFRMHVIRLSETSHLLVIVLHHIISDGWTRPILIGDIIHNYQSLVGGPSLDQLPLPVQYADYAIWQRKYLSGAVLEQKLSYWMDTLGGVQPLNLPLDYARPAVQSTKGGMVIHHVNRGLSEGLSALSKAEGVTLFMTLLAGFKVLLYRYSGQTDICVGTTVANRIQKETEPLIGCFINTLALRTDLSNTPAFKALLSQVKATALSAYEHQDVPFEMLIAGISGERDMSRNALFDVLFTLHNIDNQSVDIDGIELSYEPFSNNTSQFDINFNVTERAAGLYIEVEYCSDLFYPETITRLITHYETLLSSIVEDINKGIDELVLLPAPESELILGKKATENGEWFNKGAQDLGNDVPINVRFESIAEQYRSAVAVIHRGDHWSYEQINVLSNQIGHSLSSLGVSPGDLVGVYLDRSPLLISSLLGILKLGAVYIPLDTQNPPDRIEKMICQSEMSAVVSTGTLMKGLTSVEIARTLLVDAVDLSRASRGNLINRNEMNSWAYVLYTSGSTGEPKGAISRHDGALNHILAEYELLDLPDGFRFLQSAGIGSDVSVWQMLGPLLKGGAVVIIDKDDLLDYSKLMMILSVEEVNVVEFVPTYCWGMLDYTSGLEQVPVLNKLSWMMLTGERVPVGLVNELHKIYPQIRLLNCYGPCEASDDVVQYEVKGQLDESQLQVPIGRPIPNMNVLVLDKRGALCPIGVTGELCVSGIGVGAGYYGLPEKTAQCFIPNPFEGALGDTIYKTGDLGRWLSDGQLEFIGRVDNQVKIRGHRVELGEIESFMRQHGGVKDSHVIVHTDETGVSQLLAFILPESGKREGVTLVEDIRSWCRNGLPSYMQPSHYCEIERMPVNLSDKIDERELLQLYLRDRREGTLAGKKDEGPRNEVEQKLIQIWKEVLKVEEIGIYDNFFSLGGHSLLVTRVISSVKVEFLISIPIATLFRYTTISEISNYIQLVKPIEEPGTEEFDVYDL